MMFKVSIEILFIHIHGFRRSRVADPTTADTTSVSGGFPRVVMRLELR